MKDRLAFAFETLTVGSGNTVTTLTRSVYTPATGGPQVREALITVNPGPVVSYLILTTATVSSTVGHKMAAFSSVILQGPEAIRKFQSTSMSSGTTASISCTYFRGEG